MALIDPYVGLTKKITHDRDVRESTRVYNQAVSEVQRLTTERQSLIQQKAAIESEYINRAENYNRQANIYSNDKQRQITSIAQQYSGRALTSMEIKERKYAWDQAEAQYQRRMADHKAPLDAVVAKRNAINLQLQQIDSGLQSNLNRVGGGEYASQVSQVKSQQDSYVEQVASQQRQREDYATAQLMREKYPTKQAVAPSGWVYERGKAPQPLTTQTIERKQLQTGVSDVSRQPTVAPAVVSDTRNLQERLIAQGFTKEQTQQFFKEVEGVKGASVQPVIIKKDDGVTLVPVIRDIRKEQLETRFEQLTPTQKKIVATSALFSEKGFEMIAKEAIKGGEGMYDVSKRHFVDAGEKGFVKRTAIGSLSGSPTGVAGMVALGGAGFTKLGATKIGSAAMASKLGKIGMLGLGTTYAATKGQSVIMAKGDKEKLLEIGMKTGFEVGGFMAGASLEKSFLLKQQPVISKAISVEQVQARARSGDTELVVSKGDKIFQSEHLGKTFKGSAKYQTRTKVLDKPVVDYASRTITQDVSISAGKVTTTGAGKVKTTKFISGTRATPEIEGTGVKLFESKTMFKGGKKITTTGAVRQIAVVPEGITVSKAVSIGKGAGGREIIIVKDLPTTQTDTFNVFGGGTTTKTTITPAKTTIKITPTTKTDPLSTQFISDIKTISAGRTFAPTETIGVLSLMRPTKTKEAVSQLSVVKQDQSLKVIQPTRQKVKTTTDQKMFYDVKTSLKPASSTMTMTSPISATQVKTVSPTITPTRTATITAPSMTTMLTPFGAIGGMIPPMLGGGWGFKPVRRETPRKRKYAYTPSLTAAAFNIRFKKQPKAKRLSKKEFTGFELRPVSKPIKMRLMPSKRVNTKKLFGF